MNTAGMVSGEPPPPALRATSPCEGEKAACGYTQTFSGETALKHIQPKLDTQFTLSTKLPLLITLILALTACTNATPAPTATSPPPTIYAGIALDIAELAPLWTESVPITGAEFSTRPAMPQPVLLGQLANRQIGVAITLHQPSGSTAIATPLAQTALAIIVHPDNPASNLSSEQLHQLFSGTLTDWGEVGGTAGLVEVVSREDGSAVRAAFDARVLGGLPPTLLAIVQPSDADMAAYVAQTPGAIGYVALPHAGTANRLAIDGLQPTQPGYPLRLPVLALTSAEPDGALYHWLAWVQTEGATRLPEGYAPLEQ